MVYFAGLDVSIKETSVCIIDETGRVAGVINLISGQHSDT